MKNYQSKLKVTPIPYGRCTRADMGTPLYISSFPLSSQIVLTKAAGFLTKPNFCNENIM